MELETIREIGPDQLASLEKLFAAAHAHDGHEPLGEHKWLDLVHGGREGFGGVVANEEGHTHPVGYAHLSRHPGEHAQWGLEVVVHPEHRGIGVEAALVERALDLARDEGRGHLHMWVFQPSEIHDGIAHRFGLHRGRKLLHMRVGLPVGDDATVPDGVTLRPFEPGRDEDGWLEVNNDAFHHHPEQGAWDEATLQRRMSNPWFDPEDLLLATDDEGLAGFNWTKLDHDTKVGEIYVIAVHPTRQGTGLGKMLTIAGLEHMHDRGMHTGSLYVDADNEAAVRMYTKLGFEVHHTDRAYVIDL